ncbi:MAG TPA: hypothetical protein VIJ35_14550 [Bradyrhizobium sp.]
MRGMSDDDIRLNEAQLHARLRRIVEALPQLQGIAIMDRNGHPLVSANIVAVPTDIDFSDRDLGERFPGIPVLLTTGYSANAQDAVRQGVVVLQKPHNLESLRRNIREAIEGAKARRQQAVPTS